MPAIRKTNTVPRSRFDPAKLRELAGETVFARGEAYNRAGKVELLLVDATRVLARVTGSDRYRTELGGQGRAISGRCSCRAFEDWGFCKHMVATGLAANATAEAGGPPAEDPFSRIRRHLRAQGLDALVELVVGIAEEDENLFQRLDLASAMLSDEDDGRVGDRIRRALDRAIGQGYVEYAEVRDWSQRVGLILDGMQDLAAEARGPLARDLAAHAYEQLEDRVEEVDDSDGYCGALMRRAAEIHLAAATSEKPEPVELARDLYARELDDEYGHFFGAAQSYADVLGPAGLAEYRRLALETFATLPPVRRGDRSYSPIRQRLEGILDGFAERDGDVDARIALRAGNLTSSFDYLRLAELCLANGREADALRWAEEGLWMFEDERLDHRLLAFAVARLDKVGRKDDSARLLWRAFESGPTFDLYRQFRERAGVPAIERSIDVLRACMEPKTAPRFYGIGDLVVRILIHEKRFADAWAEAEPGKVSPPVLEALARASEGTFPRQAIEVYVGRIASLVELGGNPGYAEAAALLSHLATLRPAAEQEAHLAELKLRFARKRNFMKLLPAS